MATESQRCNCSTRNGGNAIPKHAAPEAKGSSPTTGLTLLWAHNPFGRNFNHWQVSRKEAGQMLMRWIMMLLRNVNVRYYYLAHLKRYYRGADKSLARPGRKQARKHVRDARVFDKIETRAVIKFPLLQGKAPKEIHAILTETLACFLPGRAKDLSAPLLKACSNGAHILSPHCIIILVS